MSQQPHSAIHATQYEDVDPQKEKAKGGMVRREPAIVFVEDR